MLILNKIPASAFLICLITLYILEPNGSALRSNCLFFDGFLPGRQSQLTED